MSTDAVKTKVSTHLQVVTFHLGSEDFAVEITKVKEIILFEEITKVPQCASYIEGVINLRGSIVPVIDLRKRLGMAHKELGPETRIMISRIENRSVGMIVDSVSKVMKIPKSDILPPPESLTSLAKDYLVGLAKVDKSMFLVIDFEKVLSPSEQSQLGSAH